MLKFTSKNYLLLNTLNDYFKKMALVKIDNSINRNEIFLDSDDRILTIHFKQKKKSLPLPLEIGEIIKEINLIISDINIIFKQFKYYPFRRIILNEDKKIFLTEIQNLIFSHLISADKGLEKEYLYDLIWREDKNISINKLDTHLTNLKNHLNDELGIKINFQSQNKILRLLID